MSEEEFGEEESPFEEEVETEKKITCRVCGEKVPFSGYSRHMKENHPKEYEELVRKQIDHRRKAFMEKKERLKEIEEKARKIEEMPPEQLVALYGREGLDELKLRRLLDMLEAAPNITSSQRKWIESRWKTYDRIRSDPQELFRVLKDEAGVKDKIASAIVQAVFSLESEYADILARRGEPVFMYGRTAGATEPSIEVYQQYPWQRTPRTYRPETYPTYPPYEPPSPPSYGYMYGYQPYYPRSRYAGGEPITKEELNELLDKWFSDRFEKRKLEEQINFLRNALEGVKDYVEETKHEFEKKLLMKEKEKEKDKSSEEVQLLTAKLEEAYSRINELSSQISALASTLEKREKDRLEAEIRTLREQQRELIKRLDEIGSRPTGEYSSDAYRLMSDLVREVRHRKPLEAIARILFPERFAVHPERLPSSSPLPPAMESELRAAGLLESYGG